MRQGVVRLQTRDTAKILDPRSERARVSGALVSLKEAGKRITQSKTEHSQRARGWPHVMAQVALDVQLFFHRMAKLDHGMVELLALLGGALLKNVDRKC